MKTLKFSSHLVPLILDGSKTSTWRLFDDKDLQKGDELKFVNRQTAEDFAIAKITDVREKTLGQITDEDYEDGHERFIDQADMLEHYRSYYGSYKVTLDTPVKLVNYKIIKFLKNEKK